MIICAGINETFDFAVPTGVGLIETAIHLTRLCLMDPPKQLLFVGTAGSYGGIGLLEIVEARTAANIELGFLHKQAYTPLDNVISADGSHDVIVNSSNYITTDATLATRFLSLGIGLENMEFFSVLCVAREFDIPVRGVFCTTNFCNADAHQDFKTHHAEAKARLSDWVAAKSFT